MTTQLGGRPSKDQPISDNFNPTKLGPKVSKADLLRAARQAKIAQLAVQSEGLKAASTLSKVASTITKIKKETGLDKFEKRMEEEKVDNVIAPTEPASKSSTPPSDPDKTAKIEESEAHKMLQDLRYAYKNAVGPTGLKGRRRLVELMKSDSEFKAMVRELVKVDTAIVTTKLRKGEDENGKLVGQQNFFVVLKGLDDGVKQISGAVDKTVDMKQIERAINPDENSFMYEEDSVDNSAAPEMLLGRASEEEETESQEDEGVAAW